jgi:diguanylate cyclase (GGDEF)-like protein
MQLAIVLLVMSGAVIIAGGLTIVALVTRLRCLERQALTDPLTGAFNRRHFDICLRTATDRRIRRNEPASLVVFDVDRFKEINDRFGHASGDAVLKALVVLGRRRARSLDLLFRIGGEEFALILSGARLDGAIGFAEELRSVVAASRLLDGHAVSISAGVSELRSGQSSLEWLLEADLALYHAKNAGRNQVAGATRNPGGREILRPARVSPCHPAIAQV